MKRAMDCGRLSSDVFHDVDLTAIRPANALDVITQHPEGRPDALSIRDLNPRFKTAEGLAEFVFCKQPRRSKAAANVVRPLESFFEYCDYQQAISEMRVGGAARVSLEFVVAPTLAANIEGPLARIRSEEHTSELQSHSDLVCR